MKKTVLFLVIGFGLGIFAGQAKTKKFGTWVELEISKEFLKKFEFAFIPEIRFQDDFTVDEYLFDSQLSFKPAKFISLAATYRLNTNVKKNDNETTSRFAFDATGKKEWGRFETAFRIRATNYIELDEQEDPGVYFRPRLKVEYDIKGNKIRPFASYEIFRNTTEKEFDKSRFDIGATRKFGKISRVGIYYRSQDYFSDRNSIHILGIDYRIKF
jgi:hypothetical protein